MEFIDFLDRKVELSEGSWEHIQVAHPEISIEEIKAVLLDPDEVIESPRQSFVELYYRSKPGLKSKKRFRVVVVKVLINGNFISTAMTVSGVKRGKSLYKKGSRK